MSLGKSLGHSLPVSSSVKYLPNTDVLGLNKAHGKSFQKSAQHRIRAHSTSTMYFLSFLSCPLLRPSWLQPTEAGVAHNSWANLGMGLILPGPGRAHRVSMSMPGVVRTPNYEESDLGCKHKPEGKTTAYIPLSAGNMIVSLLLALHRHPPSP